MLIFNSHSELEAHLDALRTSQQVGLVPTMGALHEGHLSLVQQAMSENQVVVISVFVNPTQFNNPEDLQKYPRTLEADVALLETLNGPLVVYAPTVEDIYGDHPVATSFDFGGLEHQMEGKFRPGHFDGVGTIVKRLFEIVRPVKAYFGEKDFQQVQIVKKMVEMTGLPVQVVECPIMRYESGLAMSSRNARLSEEAKAKAAFIYRTLLQAKALFSTATIEEVEREIEQLYANEPGFELEYFTIVNQSNLLHDTEKQAGVTYRAFVTVYLEGVRLIDTMSLN